MKNFKKNNHELIQEVEAKLKESDKKKMLEYIEEKKAKLIELEIKKTYNNPKKNYENYIKYQQKAKRREEENQAISMYKEKLEQKLHENLESMGEK